MRHYREFRSRESLPGRAFGSKRGSGLASPGAESGGMCFQLPSNELHGLSQFLNGICQPMD